MKENKWLVRIKKIRTRSVKCSIFHAFPSLIYRWRSVQVGDDAESRNTCCCTLCHREGYGDRALHVVSGERFKHARAHEFVAGMWEGNEEVIVAQAFGPRWEGMVRGLWTLVLFPGPTPFKMNHVTWTIKDINESGWNSLRIFYGH